MTEEADPVMAIAFEREARARQAHIDLLNRYAEAMDTRDWSAMKALYTEDASFGARRILVDGTTTERMEIAGPDKFVPFFATMLETMQASHYALSNHRFDIAEDGTTASASCYFRAYHTGKDDRAHLYEESLGRFNLTSVQVGGEWKIGWMEEVNMISLGTQEAWGAHPYVNLVSQ